MSELGVEEIVKVQKTVKFADGIKPGEGTSPSGGEELPSPPPPKRKLPKEQRYKKTKLKTKKKVKVSFKIRTCQLKIFYKFFNLLKKYFSVRLFKKVFKSLIKRRNFDFYEALTSLDQFLFLI